MDHKPEPLLSNGKDGCRVTLAEVHAIIADDGYSSDTRSNRLKEILADLSKEDPDCPEAAEMRDAVKQLIANYHDDDKPIAEDVL